ncbi:thiamine phosphate synthase [Domibacillus antri]|uniref:thiamine phosphate synthase n=1 Tax=Domibacillus antri TaxID=1714264 RepID=UPI000AA98D9A|nr:thiamine phosphate synthase [Domibacillus antri]
MIHAVTDGTGLSESVITASVSLHPRVDALCLREKQLSEMEISQKIKGMIERGIPSGKLIVHSFPDIAVQYDLQGVHFTEFDERMKSFKQAYQHIQAGKSVHSLKTAKQAEEDGADYIYFGHIFETSSKKGLPGRGLDALCEIAAAVSIPVIAIGGIDFGNMKTVFGAGATGAAMISAFFKNEE